VVDAGELELCMLVSMCLSRAVWDVRNINYWWVSREDGQTDRQIDRLI
jgi:hypothetical protein